MMLSSLRSSGWLLLLWLLALGPASRLHAGSSASYTLTPAAVDEGGGPGSSASYAATFSMMPGGAGTSGAYRLRTGFAGQLEEAASLQLLLNPVSLAETGTGQLTARRQETNGTLTDLPAASVVWTVLGGPLSGIAANGTVTAEPVYESSIASVQGTAGGLTGTLAFTVRETIPDNFPPYAGDRLPDWWQVQHLGLAEPAGGQGGDPDADNHNNLLEFAFGTHPADPASGPAGILYAGSTLIFRGQPEPFVASLPNSVDFRVVFARRRDYQAVGLRYQVQFSADLAAWTTSAAVPVVLAGDAEYEAVSVPWPFFVEGRKARFFRMIIDFFP